MSLANLSTNKDFIKGKVAVSVNDTAISMPNTMTVTTTQDFDRVHGFGNGEYNRGMVRKPPTYSWSLTLPASSASARVFRGLLVSKQSFTLKYKDGQFNTTTPATNAATDSEFKLIQEMLIKCRVTGMDQSYEIADMPTITFNGIALNHDFYSVSATTVNVVTATDESGTDVEYGNGTSEMNTILRGALFTDIW